MSVQNDVTIKIPFSKIIIAPETEVATRRQAKNKGYGSKGIPLGKTRGTILFPALENVLDYSYLDSLIHGLR